MEAARLMKIRARETIPHVVGGATPVRRRHVGNLILKIRQIVTAGLETMVSGRNPITNPYRWPSLRFYILALLRNVPTQKQGFEFSDLPC